MRIHSRYRGQSGFSLIEVMIAVIVLATGLLALAALQINLTSSSADAKARSRIAALLASAIDDERANGFSNIATFATPVTASAAPACTAGTSLENAICTAQQDAGVSNLQVTQTVSEWYGLSTSSGPFTTTAPCGTPAACAKLIYGDYKTIQLAANWTDATGGSRSLSASTIASLIGLSASDTLRNKPLTTSSSMIPTVHETNPSSTPGVIPVAVGNGSNSASTNPRPTLGNVLPSTTFNTLNYNTGGLNGSLSATIQKRVETTVAECVCHGSNSNPLSGDVFLGTTTYRPSYWNGLQYSNPIDAKVTPYSAQLVDNHGNPVVPQNDLCTICCRDHHDASSDVVKFDPTTGDLNRYKAVTSPTPKLLTTIDAVTGNAIPVVADVHADTYLDSCRIIRVNGLQRVAADLQSKQMGLIATSPKGFATSSVPDSSVAASYEQFVLDYLKQELNSLLASTGDIDADALFSSTTYGLNDPATIDATTISGDYRYVNGRGLYLDYLEQQALDQINSVKSDSTVCNATTPFPTCVLAFVPFSTIDVTQLEPWRALSASDATQTGRLNVSSTSTSNSASACTTAGVQIRGCVSGISSGNDSAVATMRRTNSAVAASVPVSRYDLDLNPTDLTDNTTHVHSQTDSQVFRIGTTNTASEFFVALTGPSTVIGSNPNTVTFPFPTLDLSTTNDPTVLWTVGASTDFCFASLSRTDTDPDPYDCVTPILLALPVTVTVGNYNEVVNQAISNPCNNADSTTYNQPNLICYRVTGATVTGAVGYTASIGSVSGNKTTAEQTLISITGGVSPIPKSAATVNVTFGANGTAAGTYTCDSITQVPTFTTPTSCP